MRRSHRTTLTVALTLSLAALAGLAARTWAEGEKATQLTWYGQAAFRLVTPGGHFLFLDPWLVNPKNPTGKEDLAKVERADLILVTHGHFDHVGNAAEIAKRTKARLVATYDLGHALAKHGGYPQDQMGYDTLGNFGGRLEFFDGEVRIAFVPAVHSSSVNAKDLGVGDDDAGQFAGAPGGFVVQVKNGPTIYHTGDTDVFSDMALVSEHGKIDVMLACIGDHFTMGPERAAKAVDLVKPATVVPMHFGTFPAMTGTAEAFEGALKGRGLGDKLRLMKVGETLKL